MKHEIMRLAEAMAVAMAGEKDAVALIEARAALETEVETLTEEPDRMETEYQAATLRIDNDLMVIAELTAERDALKDAARLALDALERILYKDGGEPAFFKVREAIAALKAVLK